MLMTKQKGVVLQPNKRLTRMARLLASELDYFTAQAAGSLTKEELKALEVAVRVLFKINKQKIWVARAAP